MPYAACARNAPILVTFHCAFDYLPSFRLLFLPLFEFPSRLPRDVDATSPARSPTRYDCLASVLIRRNTRHAYINADECFKTVIARATIISLQSMAVRQARARHRRTRQRQLILHTATPLPVKQFSTTFID